MLSQVVENGQIVFSHGLVEHNDAYHLVTAGFRGEVDVVSTNITLDETYFTVLVNASGGNKTITLPSAALHRDRIYNIKKIDASANTVTIDGYVAETIDNAATLVISVENDSYTITSNGAAWYII